MLISLFDALTVAPMLSAYFAGIVNTKPNIIIRLVNRFQDWLEVFYVKIIGFSLRHPIIILLTVTAIFLGSFFALGFVKKTFMPPSTQNEFIVYLEMPPGTSLQGTHEVVKKIEEKIKTLPELDLLSTVVGNDTGESNTASLGVTLVESNLRTRTTEELKESVREMLIPFAFAKPRVNDYGIIGGGQQYPFNLNIAGNDLDQLEKFSGQLIERLKKIPDLIDVNSSSQGGKPEFQIRLDPRKMQSLGVTPAIAGLELRHHVSGVVVGKLHENGLEYDIRLQLRPEQRNLRSAFYETRVPNSMFKLVPLKELGTGREKLGPARITRQDRSRVVQITANLSSNGAIGSAMDQAQKILTKEMTPPPGITYAFIGQGTDFIEMMQNMITAMFLALIFIYFVLASLYESFITPVTILFAIPPAISGAFYALLMFGEMFHMFSMIGLIMLMGLVTKNSILLVDYALRNVREGMSRNEAITQAGKVRLRPILMTSFAMIAGTIPVALGLGEASKPRTAMGIAIIGGLILSTAITLIMVPVVFGYIDRFREWIECKFRPKY